MKTLKFTTNINCPNGKAKVAFVLNNEKSISSWDVDTSNPEKILTITGDEIDNQLMMLLVQKVGFKAVPK